MKHNTSWTRSISALLLIGVMAACAPAAQITASPAASLPTATAPAVTVAADATSAASPTAESATPAAESTTPAAALTRINLNTATEADFLTIPAVGNRMVREFMEYRPYTSILQFEKEIGKYVDAAQVQAYEQYVYVPISINDSDTATLLQIPGLDESEAAALIAARPYASNEAFLTELAKVVSENELAAAQSMLAG